MLTKLTEQFLKDLQLPSGASRLKIYDSELTGLLVVKGRLSATFFVQTRVGGVQRMVKIGCHGTPRPDGHIWTVAKARIEARKLLGTMSEELPATEEPTLREGLVLHSANMRKLGRAPRSIISMSNEIRNHCKALLDQPISALDGDTLPDLWDSIVSRAMPVQHSVNQPGVASANRVIAYLSAIWNSLDKRYDLPGKNPTRRVTKGRLKPREARLLDGEFADWLVEIQSMLPIKRDLYLLCLLSGLRSESARSLTWDAIDFGRALMHVRIAKGDKPFTLPMSTQIVGILTRRKECNVMHYPDDLGWVFPSLSKGKPPKVIRMGEAKAPKRVRAGELIAVVPGLHVLRRTYNSVAMEIGVFREHREALMNHNQQGVNIESYGQPQNWDFLAGIQQQISDALEAKLGQFPSLAG